MPHEVWASFQEVLVLRRVEEDPGTGVQRIAAAEAVFPLPGEFSMNSHFIHTTSSKCKPLLLLTIMQGWCFANRFSKNAL
jgi:hypothetical protein